MSEAGGRAAGPWPCPWCCRRAAGLGLPRWQAAAQTSAFPPAQPLAPAEGSEYIQLCFCSCQRALGKGHSQGRPDAAREAGPWGGGWGEGRRLPEFPAPPRSLGRPKAPGEVDREVSLSPRPRGGGSDKSFRSSFYGGGNRCWKWAPRARKPGRLRGKQPMRHWQTVPLHTAASPGPDWLACCTHVTLPLLQNPQGFPPHPHHSPP